MQMKDDIFASWRANKFIVADPLLHECTNEHLIVLTDFAFWTLEIDNLIEWCKEHNCTQEGMTVRIPKDKTLTLFALRWA